MHRSTTITSVVTLLAAACATVVVAWNWPAADSQVTGQPREPVPPTVTQPRVDTYGYSLPERALLRIGSRRLRHRAEIRRVAFSPDGNIVAAASLDHDRHIRLWDTRTGGLLQHLTGPSAVHRHREGVSGLAFSPDGTKLAAYYINQTIRMWDVLSGREIYTIPGIPRDRSFQSGAIGFSPDGSRFATGMDGMVQVWETETGTQLYSLRVLEQVSRRRGSPEPRYLTFSHDGTYLAAACTVPAVIHVWNLQSGDVQTNIENAHESHLDSLAALSGENCIVTAGYRETAATEGESDTDAEPSSMDRTLELKVWDLETGRMVREIDPEIPAGVLGRMSLTGGGRLLAVRFANRREDGWERWFELRDVESGKSLQTIRVTRRTSSEVFSLSNDGKTFATVEGTRLGLWNAATGEQLITDADEPSGRIVNLAFAAGGEIVITGEDSGRFNAWDAQTGRLCYTRQVAERSRRPLRALSVAEDGRILATCSVTDRQEADLIHAVQFWDAKTGAFLRELAAASGPLISAELPTFSYDGSLLAVYEPSREQSATELVSLWNVETAQLVRDIKLPLGDQSRGVVAMRFSLDGRALYTVDAGGTIHTWDADSGRQLAEFQADVQSMSDRLHPYSPSRVASADFFRNAQQLLTSSDRYVSVWDLASGEMLTTITTPGADGPRRVAQAPDGKRLVTSEMRFRPGADGWAVRMWDVDSGGELFVLNPIDAAATRFAFNPDGTQLATAMDCGTVIVWDVSVRQ